MGLIGPTTLENVAQISEKKGGVVIKLLHRKRGIGVKPRLLLFKDAHRRQLAEGEL